MRGTLGYVLIAVLLALGVGFILYPKQPPAVDAVWAAELKAKSDEMNKSLPAQVDEDTLLITTATKGNILEFSHTLNLQKEDVDVYQTGRDMYPRLLENACTSTEMKIYRDHETTLHYVYYDKDGDYIQGIRVETSDCP